MRPAPDRIRNVALVGHRGSGKTSLHEALLFEAGVTTRLGTVVDGSTVSDSDADEQARQMSISASLSAIEWDQRKVNLLDTPGDPSFIADALACMRVCESAIFLVNAVNGVEVTTSRLWARAAELDLARLVFVNMLDRERADFARTLDSLKQSFGPHVVAVEIPLIEDGSVTGVIDLLDMCACRQESPPIEDQRDPRSASGAAVEGPIPDELVGLASEYRERLMDEVSEVSDELMERYLEGDEIAHEEIAAALKTGTNHGKIFPVVCGVATRNLGTARLLSAIVEDLPSPVKHGPLTVGEVALVPEEQAELFAYIFKTRADPYAGRVNLLRVYQGVLCHDTQALNTRTHARERIGQPIFYTGKDSEHVQEIGPGDMGAVAKLKDTYAGDWLAARWPIFGPRGEEIGPLQMPRPSLPAPVMAFAVEASSRGDEEKVFASLRRLQEEDPTIDLHRDPQTGEQIVAGLSQVHVEVIVDRLHSRFGVGVKLKPPRVPYRETIAGTASARGRHKKQTGGRGQFGECQIEIEPLRDPQDSSGFEFVDRIKGGVIPNQFIPAVEKGVKEAMQSGPVAGYPVKGVRVTLLDGSFHPVDSSELAFKLAGAHAMRDALAAAQPVLLEPIMLVTVFVPEEHVGEVIGDLNSRRGRPQGMEPAGAGTEIRAEAPMAEMLSYAPDLRSITQGQGDYTLELLRYEPLPAQLVARVLEQTQAEPIATHA
ncbi:MAG TPA: elongation factor G [Solirubrobacteraceae bacterium]|jgi:elongation factor G|nr:elongation factor G [Solirubrobacteraceae bacterium]